jgi:hypothetical protein
VLRPFENIHDIALLRKFITILPGSDYENNEDQEQEQEEELKKRHCRQ